MPVEARDLQKSYLNGDGSELSILSGVDFVLSITVIAGESSGAAADSASEH